jgi:hypothetical protein
MGAIQLVASTMLMREKRRLAYTRKEVEEPHHDKKKK